MTLGQHLAFPETSSLMMLRSKLIKVGAKVARHSRYVTFQPAQVAMSKSLFAETLCLIDGRRLSPLMQ